MSEKQMTPGRAFVAGLALGLDAGKWEPGKTKLRHKPHILPEDDTYTFMGFDSDYMALLETTSAGYRCAAAPEQLEVVDDKNQVCASPHSA